MRQAAAAAHGGALRCEREEHLQLRARTAADAARHAEELAALRARHAAGAPAGPCTPFLSTCRPCPAQHHVSKQESKGLVEAEPPLKGPAMHHSCPSLDMACPAGAAMAGLELELGATAAAAEAAEARAARAEARACGAEAAAAAAAAGRQTAECAGLAAAAVCMQAPAPHGHWKGWTEGRVLSGLPVSLRRPLR